MNSTDKPLVPLSALELAQRFHEAYERLAPSFGYETRTETRAFDPETPNGRLMIAVCAELAASAEADARRYRWMREQRHADIAACWFLPVATPIMPVTPEDIDAAIDEAMSR